MFFSPCGEKLKACNPAAAVCLLEKGRVKSLAKELQMVKSIRFVEKCVCFAICVVFFCVDENDELVLQSVGGERCSENPKKNYTVSVEFDCKRAMKVGNCI